MILSTLILFIFANGTIKELPAASEADCLFFQHMQAEGKLFVDDEGFARQRPVEVMCLCAGEEIEG